MQNDSVLIKIIADDHEYTVFEDGRVEGLGHNVTVINYYPRFC
jgi:hypothetical protein